MSDTLAIGVYRALYEAGLKIPGDVSVIGFDGIPFGDYLQPKLTTLSQPVPLMADSIVEQLWDMIETDARGKPVNSSIFWQTPGRVTGRSCRSARPATGTPPTSHFQLSQAIHILSTRRSSATGGG